MRLLAFVVYGLKKLHLTQTRVAVLVGEVACCLRCKMEDVAPRQAMLVY